mmetsp:Transcript_7365/g.11607  ORF Transcript_7365/g.11607 Transcript_7365/m.11607 type:complete len:116 (-) Transcript_7365:214-561(-)
MPKSSTMHDSYTACRSGGDGVVTNALGCLLTTVFVAAASVATVVSSNAFSISPAIYFSAGSSISVTFGYLLKIRPCVFSTVQAGTSLNDGFCSPMRHSCTCLHDSVDGQVENSGV